jgi:FtsZ-binding cell division protein ZapB
MPAGVVAAAPIIGPAIGAVGSLAGGIIGNKAQKNATNASLQAQREALAYEKEKDAQRKAEYDKAVEVYKQQQDAWQANRRAILGRYGVHLPDQAPGGMVGGGMTTPPPRVTLGSIAGAQPPPMMGGMSGASPAEAPMAPQPPPGDTFDWQDWSRYAPIQR